MPPPEISVIIPAYNEAGNIMWLIDELRGTLDNRIQYELIYVDDGSTDNTLEELQTVRKQGFQGLRILQHASRCGQSAAIVTGVAAARADWIVTLDADGQNDPVDIPALLTHLMSSDVAERPDLITGCRVNRQDNWLKKTSSRIANSVRQQILHDEIQDTGCSLKLFSRQTFLTLPHFNHMHRFLPALFKRQGARIEVLPVSHRPRRFGYSKYGVHNRLWTGILDLMGVAWLLRRNHLPGSVREY